VSTRRQLAASARAAGGWLRPITAKKIGRDKPGFVRCRRWDGSVRFLETATRAKCAVLPALAAAEGAGRSASKAALLSQRHRIAAHAERRPMNCWWRWACPRKKERWRFA